MIGTYQFLLEEHIHLTVYRVKIWDVRVGQGTDDNTRIYEENLLKACDSLVKRIFSLIKSSGDSSNYSMIIFDYGDRK